MPVLFIYFCVCDACFKTTGMLKDLGVCVCVCVFVKEGSIKSKKINYYVVILYSSIAFFILFSFSCDS